MKERPILFSGSMVRAILEGRKTVTRRIVKPRPVYVNRLGVSFWEKGPVDYRLCPYGQAGDRLWVREAWRCRGGREYEYQQHQPSILYRCDAEAVDYCSRGWRPSIHMPRWASRITLEVTGVVTERLQEITEEDAKAEGVTLGEDRSWAHREAGLEYKPHVIAFSSLWQSINGKGSWAVNPWVWVIQFKRLEAK